MALHASDDWQLLGKRNVGRAAETDGIDVGLRNGLYNAIRIDVNEGTVEMYNIRIKFMNGEDFSPDTRLVFKEGERTRVIDLPGDARGIRRIEFTYRNTELRGQAVVSVFGRETGGTPDGAPAGWDLVGSREVSFQAEHDVFEMPGTKSYRSLMFQVGGGDLDMFNVKITFANGETYSPDTRFHFDSNTQSRTIDLPGALRDIRRINFYYRSVKGGGDGHATIKVFGRK
ncbi:MAG: hypothetical protein ABI836_06205 [Gemmatimonadota bacterium]